MIKIYEDYLKRKKMCYRVFPPNLDVFPVSSHCSEKSCYKSIEKFLSIKNLYHF